MHSLLTFLLGTPPSNEVAKPAAEAVDSKPFVAESFAPSPASEEILRRGNWDYMWRKARDLGAQSHPEFSPDDDPGIDDDQTYR